MNSNPPSDGTRAFYDRTAQTYFGRTRDLDLDDLYHPFLSQLEPGTRILDAGCGPGRDLKRFADRGFEVVGIDASSSMVALAREHSGQEVHLMTFQGVTWLEAFGGIWACASLLHVPLADLPEVLGRLARALRLGGVMYVSFKLGSGERTEGERRFTDLDPDGLERVLLEVPGLAVSEVWITADMRPGRGQEEWLNVVLNKTSR